jgi:hypothetical protein
LLLTFLVTLDKALGSIVPGPVGLPAAIIIRVVVLAHCQNILAHMPGFRLNRPLSVVQLLLKLDVARLVQPFRQFFSIQFVDILNFLFLIR